MLSTLSAGCCALKKQAKGRSFRDLVRSLELVTSLRKNMKGQLMLLSDRILLRKRFIIETINGQLKNTSQIEHTRHRSPTSFAVNLVAGLIAYTHRPKKPTIRLPQELAQLPALI